MEIRVQIAVLVIAADPATAEAATIDVVVDKAVRAGHSIIARETVRDAVDDVRAKLEEWIADPEIDVIIASAGTDTQHAPAALRPLVSEAVPGFTDLFRWLAFQEVGASAMLAIAEAARCGTTFVFVLPAAPGAVATAMDKLILPQLDVHTTPKNLVAQMPRLRAFVPAPPIVADSKADQTIKTDAVPTPLTMEKTEAGHGLVPRLPAAGAHVVRKEPAAKPPPPEEKTRIISADQLESKIRQSNEHDAPTRVSVDIAKMLPRVPPGADDIDDDGATADLADVISPQPFARAKTPSQGKPGVKKPPTVQIPVRTKAPSGAPIAMLKKDESGRVIIPGGPREAGGEAPKKDKSGPVVIPIAKMAKALKQSPPSDEAVTVHQKKPPADEATTIRATPQKKSPTPAPTPEPIAAAGSAPVKQAPPATPVDASDDASASGSRPMTLDDSQIEEINEELAPKRRPATTPPPTPIIADIRARRREPTPLPLLAKRPDDDLPQGRFNYPTHRNRSGRRIAIFVVLAFAAAAAGIAFVHFVLQRPHTPPGEPNANLAVVPVAPDAAEPAQPPPPPVAADAEIPEIDIEVPANPPPQPPPHPHPHPPTGNHHPIVTPIDGGGASASLDAGAAVEEGCDEVTCVMEKYEKPCCARFKPSDDANYRPHVGVPGGLDKVMVREAMENVKPRVIACGEQNGAKGTVKLAIVVAPDGSVRSVTVTDAPQPTLGTCVAAAVKAAQFEKTAKGGSFNYPFVF